MRERTWGALGSVLLIAGCVGAVPLFGCSLESPSAAGDAGPPEDGRDGGFGIDPDGARDDGGPRAPFDASPIDGAVPPAPGENRDDASCFDFVDTDLDGNVDCGDLECSVSPVCCVGSSADGCCSGVGPPTTYDFAACAGVGAAAITSCFPEVVLFGSPQPELRAAAGVAPLGGDRYDSGVVLDETVDPRVAVVHVTARVLTATPASCDGCIDYVAVGLVGGAQTFGATTRVSPDAAVVINAARSELRLLVGDAMVGRWAFSELGGTADTTYELVASPAGTLALGVGGTPLVANVPWAPAGPARVVVYGRAANPGGATVPMGTSLASVTLSSEVCDAPASIERGASPILPAVDSFWTATDQPTAPSIVGDDMVYAFEGRIHRATATASMDGRFRAVSDPHVASNALLARSQAPGQEFRWESVSEPELVVEGSQRRIFFTATDEDGRTVIGLATASSGWIFDNVVQFYPSVTDTMDASSYDGPSYLRTSILGAEQRFLALRRVTAEGGELVLLELSASGDGVMGRADTEADPAFELPDDLGVVHGAGRTTTAFDADEVAAPGLVAYDALLRLYFAGRRGTRWAIGMLVSSDGRYWHLVEDGHPLISGSGLGFDAISVSDPEPVHVGRELRLYYTAHDGARRTIGMGRHLVTETAP